MLTQEQINEIRAKSGLTPLQNTQPTAKNTVGRFDYLLQDKKTEDKGGFINDAKQTIGKTATKIKETFKRQEESLMKGDITGQNPLETGVQTVGSLIEGGYGLIFDALKALTPEPAKEAIKGKAEQIVQNKTLQDVVSSVNDWAEKNPRAAADLSGLLNIASLIPAGKGAETAVDVAQQAGKVALKAGEDTGKVIGKAVGKLADKTQQLTSKGIDKATDIITPIDKGVETVLAKPTTKIEKLADYERVAKEAILDYSKPTPLELAGRKAEEALKNIQGQMKLAAESKKSITQSMSNVNTGNIVETARNEMRSLLKDRTGLQFSDKGLFKNAPGRLSAVSDKADLELLKNIDFKLTHLSKNPTFQKVDDAIDWMQDLLYKRRAMTAIPINGKVEGIIKGVVKNLNDNLKTIGGKEYTALNNAYSKSKSTFDKLNKALGVEGNKGAALMKQLFSPSGTAPRKLFDDIKNLTGIDLVDEATLAKFVMENVGDVRQASLLEQVIKGNVPTNAKSLIQMAAEKTIGKLQNPLAKAKRIVGRSK